VAQLVAIERYQVITQDEPDQGILIGQLDDGRQFSVLSCRRDPSGNDHLEIAVRWLLLTMDSWLGSV
jgi:hypothetical protein